MNTILSSLWIISVFFFVFTPSFVHALSNSTHAQYLASSLSYRTADKKLNTIWNKAKICLSREDFLQLLREQRQWLRVDRDTLAQKRMREGASPQDAYACVTEKRAQEIANRIKSLYQDKKTNDKVNSKKDGNSMLLPEQSINEIRKATLFLSELLPSIPEEKKTRKEDFSLSKNTLPFLQSAHSLNKASAVPSAGLCESFLLGQRL
ncbi:MAG: DUF1311 domain-containing protein, partial [Desulfovibrio sp.]|nr:DUF1311 domain-containing protein [Desulfovibrio sp.]